MGHGHGRAAALWAVGVGGHGRWVKVMGVCQLVRACVGHREGVGIPCVRIEEAMVDYVA